jgi:hypothetical protein
MSNGGKARMTNKWLALKHRFEAALKAMEGKRFDGNALWRLCCLEQALELLEEDPDAASKHLDDFDRTPASQEETDLLKKFPERPAIEGIRTRFDNLGGGIV